VGRAICFSVYVDRTLADRLGLSFQVFLPQRDGQLLSDLVAGGMIPREAAEAVFSADMTALRQCRAVIAVLDGRTIDEGVAFEIGVASSLGKVCVGLQTDVRRLLPFGNNPMIECALAETFRDVAGLANWLDRLVAN
jgi:nucleoside 2-deoxyribosyltransferase